MSIYKKLQAIQQELKCPKNQYNKFWKYYYRNAEDILNAVKPLLDKHNCTLILYDELINQWDRYYVQSIVKIFDLEWWSDQSTAYATWYAREDENLKGMHWSQVTWSTSSYARKYALNGLFLIDDVKDSDSTNTHWTATEKDYKKFEQDVTEKGRCKKCWMATVFREWTTKKWDPYKAYFCSSKDQSHTEWLK